MKTDKIENRHNVIKPGPAQSAPGPKYCISKITAFDVEKRKISVSVEPFVWQVFCVTIFLSQGEFTVFSFSANRA